MKTYKKLLLAGFGLGLGIMSSTSIALPPCDVIIEMCEQGDAFMCRMARGCY